MFYTSYFDKPKKLPSHIVPVAICGKCPDKYTGLQYKKLAPKYSFFMEWKQTNNNDYYIRCFNEQVLSNLDPAAVASELSGLAGGKDVALICYEKPGDFCHRHLVAYWLNSHGYETKEWEE